MAKTIEIVKVSTTGDTIRYELWDNTGLGLLKKQKVEAWVKFHNVECFGFSAKGLPESILVLPITLYLLPVTWFYGVELVVPSIDKRLYERLPQIYNSYSKIYGPFKEEWHGKVTAKTIVENKIPESRFDNVIFFSGGIDAVHAGINNLGKSNVLVTVPSIEGPESSSKEISGQHFLVAKSRLIREFSAVSGSDWLMVTNNFRMDIFDDSKIQHDLRHIFALNSAAFLADGWFGIKYLGNLLSSAPFAYAMGIPTLIMGSTFEPIENQPLVNQDGANPELSDVIKFAGISFAGQDGQYMRRSQKMKNIAAWCAAHGKKIEIWACCKYNAEQCCMCHKCMRTLLNILCVKEKPVDWGFVNFDEKKFSHLVRFYRYYENNPCWIWDIIDSIDDDTVYPYCDKLLHWLKKTGYKRYFKRVRKMKVIRKWLRIVKVHKYPHYVKVMFSKLAGKKLE